MDQIILNSLYDLLVNYFGTPGFVEQITGQAGISRGSFGSGPPEQQWWEIMEIVRHSENLARNLIDRAVAAAERRFADDKEITEKFRALYLQIRPPARGQEIPTANWHGESGAHLEAITGQFSTFLSIAFLERGLNAAKAVARVVGRNKLGTGFLLPGNLFMTNHHVIGTEAEAVAARIEFNYQEGPDRRMLEVEEMRLNPVGGFATSRSEENDWTVVRVEGDANARWGELTLSSLVPQNESHANIIQHPEGLPKQIALYHNIVAHADESRVQYLTDTKPGSSGSPVFNDSWEVIALHHSGGNMREPGTNRVYLRNEGTTACLIAKALKEKRLLL